MAHPRNRPGLRIAGLLALLLVLSPSIGCKFKGGPDTAPPDRGPLLGLLGDKQPWQPRPVRFRVFPTTRFVSEGGSALLELRLEFFDEAGDSIKAVGDIRVDLFASRPGGGEADTGRRLYVWNISLRTLEENQSAYDVFSRGYLFRLRLDEMPGLREPMVLVASLLPPEGRRLEARAMIGADGVIVTGAATGSP